MRESVLRPIVAVLLIAVLTVAYAGSYAILVRKSLVLAEGPRFVCVPSYRFGGEPAKSIFFPAHFVDRLLRPGHWGAAPASSGSLMTRD
jgi:hypothetical protein